MGCFNSIVINAPTDDVWEVLRNFHNLSWAKNVITKLDIIGDRKDDEVGAKRILNDVFHETLMSVDDDAKKFTYSIDDGPGPVSKENVDGYIGTVEVLEVSADNTSYVSWKSEWANAKEDGVADFCNPIYHALLQDLKGNFS